MREIKIRAKPDKACFFEPDSVPTRDKERNHGLHGLRGFLINEHEFHELNELLKGIRIMAATDYVIVTGWMNAYLTKKKKPTKNGPQTMSQDRRPITESEMIGLFEFYLRKWCEEHEGEDTVVITNSDGKKIFEATLLDKEDDV